MTAKVLNTSHDKAISSMDGSSQEGDIPYRDHAHVVDVASSDPLKAQRGAQNFPVKLHYMLCEVEQDGHEGIVSWQPHGRCFLVHDQEKFVKQILPFWFRQTKFASFQRQLNLYGFKRLSSGNDKHGYYHERFLRGKGFLAQDIQRVKVKGDGGIRKPSVPARDPNFYAMTYLPSTNGHGTDSKAKQQNWNSIALQARSQIMSTAPDANAMASNPFGFAGTVPSSLGQQPANMAGMLPQSEAGVLSLALRLAEQRQQQSLSDDHVRELVMRASLGNMMSGQQQQGANPNFAGLGPNLLQQQQQFHQQQLQQLQQQQARIDLPLSQGSPNPPGQESNYLTDFLRQGLQGSGNVDQLDALRRYREDMRP